jgi:hypothetical protein
VLCNVSSLIAKAELSDSALCILLLSHVIWYYFLGKLQKQNSYKVFLMEKKITRIMAGAQKREACTGSVKRFSTLTLASEYTFALMIHTVESYEMFQLISGFHKVSTTQVRYPQTNSNLMVY